MRTTKGWRSRPIFVTSTFRDMNAERDHLRDHVFPILEERLRERRQHLEPIDLRWGVATVAVDDERAKELLVLSVCLGEIERSRPFLVGLIGDRYGWVPPGERLAEAASEVGYGGDLEGRSITALEVEFGVLESPDQRRRSHFYLRDPLPYDEMDRSIARFYSEAHSGEPDAADAARRLAALKARILRELPERTRSYRVGWDGERQRVTDLDEFGRLVLEDLWRDLDAETLDAIQVAPVVWQDEERWLIEERMASSGRSFVGREAILADLVDFATGLDVRPPLRAICVFGPAGAGKSSLCDQLAVELEKRARCVLLVHAAGLSPRSVQTRFLLERWIGDLATFLGESRPISEEPTAGELAAVFRSLLFRAAERRRVVLLLDGLDEMEPTPSGRYLTWLPSPLPDEARLVVTSAGGPQVEELGRQPGWEVRGLPTLSPEEGSDLVEAICRRHHRTPPAEVVSALVSKSLPSGERAAASPLWLELATEQLNLLGADDFSRADRLFSGTPEARLLQMLLDFAARLPAEVEGLFASLLSRVEELLGSAWAHAFAVLMATSRTGLRESDLKQLVPPLAAVEWSDLDFAALRRIYRGHLVQRGLYAQWDLRHDQMRRAIERRYLSERGASREVHARLADHLDSLAASDSLRATETMTHLIGADRPHQAARWYARARTAAEIDAATVALVTLIGVPGDTPSPGLAWACALLDSEEVDSHFELEALCNRVLDSLDPALAASGHAAARELLLRATHRALERALQLRPDDPLLRRSLGVCRRRVAEVLAERGDLEPALIELQKALAIQEPLAAEPFDAFDDRLGSDLVGDLQRELRRSYTALADVMRATGNLGGAVGIGYALVEMARQQVARSRLPADAASDLALALRRSAGFLLGSGDTTGALAALEESRALLDGLAHERPTDWKLAGEISAVAEMKAIALRSRGDWPGVIASLREVLNARQMRVRTDPSDDTLQALLAQGHHNLAEALRGAGRAREAVTEARAATQIRRGLVNRGSGRVELRRDLAASSSSLGAALLAVGDPSGALAALEESLAINEHLSAEAPENASRQRDLALSLERLGQLRRSLGDPREALRLHRRALDSRAELVRRDVANRELVMELSNSHELVGDALEEMRDERGALTSHERALELRRGLTLLEDSDNTEWLGGLVTSCQRVGKLRVRAGNPERGLPLLQQALTLAERLARASRQAAQMRRTMAVCCLQIAEAFHALRDRKGEREHLRRTHTLLRELRDSGFELDPPLREVLEQMDRRL